MWHTPRRACASMASVYAADSGAKPAAVIAVSSRAASAECPPLASTHSAACSTFGFGFKFELGFGLRLEPEQLHRVGGAVGRDPVRPHPLQQLQRLRMRRAEAHKPADLCDESAIFAVVCVVCLYGVVKAQAIAMRLG